MTSHPRLSHIAVATVVLAAVGFLLLGQDFTFDGLQYATAVELGGPLWHANHLLANYFYRAVYLLVGSGVRAVWVMQAVNVVAGALGVVLLFGLLRRHASRPNAVAIAALVFFSFGWWAFSHEPEVYIPPLMLIVLQMHLLFSERVTLATATVVTLLCALTILFHQKHVLWFFFAGVMLWRHCGEWRDRRVFTFALGVPALVLVAYVALGIHHDAFGTWPSTLEWFLGHAYTATDGVGLHRPAAPLGQRILLATAAAANTLLPYELIAQPWWLIGVGVVAALALLGLVVTGLVRRVEPAQRFLVGWLVGMAAAYFAFAAIWEARNVEFMVTLLVPGALLAALAVGQRPAWVFRACAMLIVALNLALSHVPAASKPDRYLRIERLDEAVDLGPYDAVIAEELNTVAYLRYLRGKDVRFIPGAVSHALMVMTPLERFQIRFQQRIRDADRVYTLENGTWGRLRWMAERAPWLAERRTLTVSELKRELYAPYDLAVVDGVEGVYRVTARGTSASR